MEAAFNSRPTASRAVPLLLALITILLLALLATQVYILVSTSERTRIEAERAANYRQRVETIAAAASAQRDAIEKLDEAYRKAAYEDPQVKGVAQQHFRAAEATLEALRLIGIQNSQIIELLSTVP